MAYKVIILYQLYMPSYFLGTFTEYPFLGVPVRYPLLFSYHTDFDYFVINTIFTEIFLEYDKEDNY